MLKRVLEPEVMDDPAEAASYDQMDHSEPNGAFVARLVELVRGASGDRRDFSRACFLDIGTGPGQQPPMICDVLGPVRIIGVDRAESMLRRAVARAEGSRWEAHLEYLAADAKRLPFADDRFDAVLSNTILHHIPNPEALLAEAWRVLKPDGALLIRDLYRPADEQILEWLVSEHAAGADAGQQQLFRQSLHAALTPLELRQAVARLGLKGLEVVIDTDRHVSVQKAAN